MKTTVTTATMTTNAGRRPRGLLRAAALFMLYLIMSLTFIPALSMRAEAVLVVEVKGQDGVPSFRRTNDTTTIMVFADSETVKLLGASGSLDLACTPAGPGYRCTYIFPQTYQSPGRYSLTLQQESGTPPTATTSYIVDGKPPAFGRLEFTQQGRSISAAYSVTDTSGSSTSDCSGLSLAQLIVNENEVARAALSGGCAHEGTLSGEAPGLEGETRLYLRALDKLGNAENSSLVTRSIDTVEPSLPGTYQLLRNGEDLTMLSTETSVDVRADLVFTVSDYALATVTVDASSLSTTQGHGYRALTASCAGERLKTCRVPNLKVDPAEPRVPLIISATDASGNTARGPAYKTLTIQNTKPSVTYVGRVEPRCDACFFTSGLNELLAIVEAPGGMHGKELFLSLDGRSFAAKSCTAQGSTWNCLVDVSFTTGARKRVTIDARSMDDLGNAMSGILEKEFVMDNGAPRIINYTTDAACPTAGQRLRLLVNVRDETSPSLSIVANASHVTDREMITGRCTPDKEKLFSCELIIDSFLSVHTRGEVPITVTDEAGNAARITVRLEVCEAAADVTPNFISRMAAVGPLPAVDKRLASLIPYRVVVPLSLTLTGNARVIQARSVRCTTPMISGPSYVMNEFSAAPVLVTHYKYDGFWPNGSVDLNCTLDFTIRRGNTVYVKPESENLSVTLPLVRQELGNPGQAIREKERALVGEINKLQERIESKAKIDDSLGKICRMARMMGEANAALQTIKAVLYGVAMAMTWAGNAGKALWTVANTVLGTWHQTIITYIWPIGWYPPKNVGHGLVGYMMKWTCGLYECKHYDAATWTSFIMDAMAVNTYNKVEPSLPSPPTSSFTPPTPPSMRGTDNGRYFIFVDSENRMGVMSGSGLVTPKSQREGYRIIDPWARQAGATSATASLAENVQTAITGDKFVVNPYRSTYYDALCYPAQLYNARKEKQLKCLQLRCVREAATTGMPIQHCDERYAAQHCLYVESAQGRLHHDLKDVLEKKVAAIAMQLVIAFGVQCGFKKLCKNLYPLDYFDPCLGLTQGVGVKCATQTQVTDWNQLQECGVFSAVCGLLGAGFQFDELKKFQESLRAQNPAVPVGEDFCAGLDGVTPDETVKP